MVNMLFKKVLDENEKCILYFYLKLKAIFWPANNQRLKYCCSVAKLCPTLCDPMNCSTPGLHKYSSAINGQNQEEENQQGQS